MQNKNNCVREANFSKNLYKKINDKFQLLSKKYSNLKIINLRNFFCNGTNNNCYMLSESKTLMYRDSENLNYSSINQLSKYFKLD